MAAHPNNCPKLHNAAWPGLVGKGGDDEGSEPAIDLGTMLDMTAATEVDNIKFDGFDIFLGPPHFNINDGINEARRLAEMAQIRGLDVGTLVAPIYEGAGGGSPIGTKKEKTRYIVQVRKTCKVAQQLRELGARPHGNVRIDTGINPEDWAQAPTENTKKIAAVFQEACAIAEGHGERLVAEGEICWGGMHSWREMIKLLEMTNRPDTLGFQADMSHTLLYLLGYNAPVDEEALLPADFTFNDVGRLNRAYRTMTNALRPWTRELHVAQNDGTVHGTGDHDKTGRHCVPDDPNGKLDIPQRAGYWLRNKQGQRTKAFPHICWDGCMFPNAVLKDPQTWKKVLTAMIAVRDAHGWYEDEK
jgi:sugar phosphate isomerase/epimerase